MPPLECREIQVVCSAYFDDIAPGFAGDNRRGVVYPRYRIERLSVPDFQNSGRTAGVPHLENRDVCCDSKNPSARLIQHARLLAVVRVVNGLHDRADLAPHPSRCWLAEMRGRVRVVRSRRVDPNQLSGSRRVAQRLAVARRQRRDRFGSDGFDEFHDFRIWLARVSERSCRLSSTKEEA